jgi:hypothetical protein
VKMRDWMVAKRGLPLDRALLRPYLIR